MAAYLCTGCFILFDVVTGLIKAWHNKNIDSTILRQGLFNKLTEIVAVLFATFLEFGTDKIHLGIDLPVVTVVCSYICLMEFISVIENLCEVNPHLAKLFGKYLQKAKQEEDKHE